MRLSLLCCFALGFLPFVRAEDPGAAAIGAAWQWLVYVDGGDHPAAWNSCSVSWQQQTTEENWVAALRAVRNPLGEVKKREVVRVITATSLPGRAEGNYAIVQFSADFEVRAGVMEKLTLERDSSGKWKVCDYEPQ